MGTHSGNEDPPREMGTHPGKWGPPWEMRTHSQKWGTPPGKWGPTLLPQPGSEISPGGPWVLIYGEKLGVWACGGGGPLPAPHNTHR